MNRLLRSLMLSTFILSNVLTPLSYANLENDLFEDASLNETQQENVLEKSINSEPENTESTSENINDNEDVNPENLSKPENDITISEVITSDDGCYTFDTDTQTIISYNCTDTNIEIPSTISWVDVKIIWANSFEKKWLISVKIPNTVEEIWYRAFWGDSSHKTLTNLFLWDNVKIIRSYAFYNNKLSVIILPDSLEEIETYAFSANSFEITYNNRCIYWWTLWIATKDLSTIHRADNFVCLQLETWYNVVYKDWDDTYDTSITTGIVENLPWTKEWYELVWWYTDSELSTPFDFTQIITSDTTLYGKWNKIYNDGCYTFNEWTQTITAYNASCGTEIVIPSSFDDVEVKIIWTGAFWWKWLTSVEIPDSVETIQKEAFKSSSSNKTLKNVKFWNHVKIIWEQAFYSQSLTTIILPDSIESIDKDAFNFNIYTENLQNGCNWWVLWLVTKPTDSIIRHNRACLTYQPAYKVSYISWNETINVKITTWIVENMKLSPREWYLFDAWYKDENYTEKFDFSGTQTNPITEDTALYAKWDEIVRTDDWCYKFNKDKKTIIWFGWTWTCGTDIEIPSQIDGITVESIWWWAMNWSGAFFNKWLTSVKIPDSVKEIQDRAFLQNNLNYVSLWNSIEKIWRHAFQDNKLETIYIPNSVTEIWNWAFSWNVVSDIPCATHLSGYWYWVVWVYLSGDDTHLFSKDTCLQFQQWYSVKYMSWDSLYREDVSTWSVKNIELTWKDYYNFSGWYLDNSFSSKFDFSTTINWNTTLFAYRDPIKYYITYELNGWINNSANPNTYTIESSDIILKAPTRNRYSFIWWTNVDITTPTMSITIKWWSTGDKSYTANWELNGYSWRWRMSSNNLDNEKETSFESDTKNNEDENSKNEEKSDSNPNWNYDQELLDAYNWAVNQWLINSSFEDLFNEWALTRGEMAKIAVKYVQMLWMEKKLDEDVSYPDVNSSLWELENYIKSAYQYQIMWIHADWSKLTNFKPNKFVSRWEFATVFSRILHGFEYNINWANYYEKHLEVLKSEWILKDTNPARVEEKKWVILIMYRYQKK